MQCKCSPHATTLVALRCSCSSDQCAVPLRAHAGSVVTVNIGTAGAMNSDYSQSLPPTNTSMVVSITRNGVTTTYTASATATTVSLVGSTTKVIIGFSTAADGTQNAYARIYNSQLSFTVASRSDSLASLFRLDAASYTAAAPLTPPVTGLLGSSYSAAATGLALSGATSPSGVLVASLSLLPAGSPMP